MSFSPLRKHMFLFYSCDFFNLLVDLIEYCTISVENVTLGPAVSENAT